ncbi:MAG: recombinase family protein, partial [Butyricicoccus sp.]
MTAIYARQSVDKADSISIALQIETCRARLAPDEPAETYADKGFSGKNTDRPAFQRLLDDVKTGRVTKILAYRLDRISRSVHD